jgi:hypothetical protein
MELLLSSENESALGGAKYSAVDLHLQTHADDFYSDPDYSWDEYIQS